MYKQELRKEGEQYIRKLLEEKFPNNQIILYYGKIKLIKFYFYKAIVQFI